MTRTVVNRQGTPEAATGLAFFADGLYDPWNFCEVTKHSACAGKWKPEER